MIDTSKKTRTSTIHALTVLTLCTLSRLSGGHVSINTKK